MKCRNKHDGLILFLWEFSVAADVTSDSLDCYLPARLSCPYFTPLRVSVRLDRIYYEAERRTTAPVRMVLEREK